MIDMVDMVDMEEKIFQKLVETLGYTERSAKITAQDLCKFQDQDLKDAVVLWMNQHLMTDIQQGEYSARKLMEEYGMKYPAALIQIEWLRTDYEEASNALRCMM